MGSITTRQTLLAVSGLALGVIFAGCGSDDDTNAHDPSATPSSSVSPPSESPTSDAATPATPASPSPFESARHGYRVVVPPDWEVEEYPGTWTDLKQFNPGAEVPGEDVVSSADGSSFLVMDSMAIPAGTAPEDWLNRFDAIVEAERSKSCPATTVAGDLAGRPATIVEEICDGHVLRGHSLTYGGRGYYFTTLSPDDSDALAVIEELTASIKLIG